LFTTSWTITATEILLQVYQLKAVNEPPVFTVYGFVTTLEGECPD